MSRLALSFALLLALTPLASADDSQPPPPRPRLYASVSLATLLVVGELAVEAGVRPIRRAGFLWLHAKALVGGDDSGDRSSYAYKAALAGIELRSGGRRLRGVFGLDVGAARVAYSSEDVLQGRSTELVWTWHAAAELVIDPAFVQLGVTGYVRWPFPMLALGVGIQF